MTTKPTLLITIFLLCHFLSCCFGDYCRSNGHKIKYCPYGCCNNYDGAICCNGKLSLIIGLVVGGGVVLFFIILGICLCRRRGIHGNVFSRQQPPPSYVIQQTQVTSSGGVVTTTGVPGVVYPAQPTMYPNYPMYAMTQPIAPPAYPGPQPAYASPPPAYQDVTGPNTQTGGNINPAFDAKN